MNKLNLEWKPGHLEIADEDCYCSFEPLDDKEGYLGGFIHIGIDDESDFVGIAKNLFLAAKIREEFGDGVEMDIVNNEFPALEIFIKESACPKRPPYLESTAWEIDYVFVETKIGVEKWAQDAGWDDLAEFEKKTGVKGEELIGKWFTVALDRVYFKDEMN